MQLKKRMHMHFQDKIDDFEAILRSAGQILLRFPREKLKTKSYIDENLKSNIDEVVNDYILNGLQKLTKFPIISEEDSTHTSGSRPEQYFLIDPLDGTRSYVEGFSTYATQIAFIQGREVAKSFIYIPALDEFFSASLNQGSFLNGRRLQPCRLKEPFAITDNYKEPTELISAIMKKSTIKVYIEAGSLAYKMCSVAKQTAQVFIKETRIADWDIAPAKLILEEIGANVSLLSGDEYRLEGNLRKKNLLVTSNEDIKRYILEINKADE
jgi:fructose-1,6-bisphosphatase/inositol monophosphatase family enzyme